jgi:hypothetical protein
MNTQEAEVNPNVLLNTAAVGLLIAGGVTYTMRSEPARSDQAAQASGTKPPPRSRVERVMDPAGASTSAHTDQSRSSAQDQSAATPNPGKSPGAQGNQRTCGSCIQMFNPLMRKHSPRPRPTPARRSPA